MRCGVPQTDDGAHLPVDPATEPGQQQHEPDHRGTRAGKAADLLDAHNYFRPSRLVASQMSARQVARPATPSMIRPPSW